MKGIFNITIGTQNATKILAIISEAGKMNSCRILRKGHKLYWSPSMTPERAAELVDEYWNKWRVGDTPMREIFQQAILAACKEQKELDAKICEGIGPDDWTGENCAKAIRSAE